LAKTTNPEELVKNLEKLYLFGGETLLPSDSHVGTELPDNYQHLSNQKEAINLIRAMGLDVDDDNDPIPENVPDPAEMRSTFFIPGFDLKTDQSWGWSGIDPRKDKF